MRARKIIQLRRRQMLIADPGDRVILDGVILRCCLCRTCWPVSLGESGDEVPDAETRCPECNPEQPSAA